MPGQNGHDVQVVIRASDWNRLQQHLFQTGRQEQHAFLYAGRATLPQGTRLLVWDMQLTQPQDFTTQAGGYLRLREEYHRDALTFSSERGFSLIEVHCHRFGDAVAFSSIDLANDRLKFPYVAKHIPHIRHVTMVCSPTGAVHAHTWDPEQNRISPVTELRIVADHIRRLVPDGSSPTDQPREMREDDDRYSRQVLAFGPEGQHALANTRVGVVGLGGNGAPLVQTLAHMGITQFVLVDPDTIELSNVNRIVGATPLDVGMPKVQVAARLVRILHEDADIVVLPHSVLEAEAVKALSSVDILVGATDSAASRFALTLLATRYLLPYVDLGVHVAGQHGVLNQCFGQVRLSQPDGPCLACLGGVDRVTAGQELATPEEQAMRRAAGYGTGMSGPVASLAPINGIIANIGALHVLSMITGAIDYLPYWYVDLMKQTMLAFAGTRDTRCTICAEAGLGDLLPWPQLASSRLPTNIPDIARA